MGHLCSKDARMGNYFPFNPCIFNIYGFVRLIMLKAIISFKMFKLTTDINFPLVS